MNITDPVCGKEMDLCDAFALEDHEGWAYFFCSPECHEAFKWSPGRFAKMPDTASGRGASNSTDSLRTAT